MQSVNLDGADKVDRVFFRIFFAKTLLFSFLSPPSSNFVNLSEFYPVILKTVRKYLFFTTENTEVTE